MFCNVSISCMVINSIVEKSKIFSANVNPLILSDIHQRTSFKLGLSRFRYLCVPMVSGRLTTKFFDTLIEKIAKRISSWSSKRLFYAGLLQLIRYVLFSLQNICRSLFILHSKVISRNWLIML